MVDGSFLNSFPSDSLLGRRATDLEDLEQRANDKEGLACSIVREFYGTGGKQVFATTVASTGGAEIVGAPVIRLDHSSDLRALVVGVPRDFLRVLGAVGTDDTLSNMPPGGMAARLQYNTSTAEGFSSQILRADIHAWLAPAYASAIISQLGVPPNVLSAVDGLSASANYTVGSIAPDTFCLKFEIPVVISTSGTLRLVDVSRSVGDTLTNSIDALGSPQNTIWLTESAPSAVILDSTSYISIMGCLLAHGSINGSSCPISQTGRISGVMGDASEETRIVQFLRLNVSNAVDVELDGINMFSPTGRIGGVDATVEQVSKHQSNASSSPTSVVVILIDVPLFQLAHSLGAAQLSVLSGVYEPPARTSVYVPPVKSSHSCIGLLFSTTVGLTTRLPASDLSFQLPYVVPASLAERQLESLNILVNNETKDSAERLSILGLSDREMIELSVTGKSLSVSMMHSDVRGMIGTHAIYPKP